MNDISELTTSHPRNHITKSSFTQKIPFRIRLGIAKMGTLYKFYKQILSLIYIFFL